MIDTETLEAVARVAREVASAYGCGGTHDTEMLSDAFNKFADALESEAGYERSLREYGVDHEGSGT